MSKKRLQLVLDRVAVGGDGLGHTLALGGERRVVLVPDAFPGDEVEVEVDPTKRPLRGRVVRLLSPSPERRPSPCPHSKACGGCAWIAWSQPGRWSGYRTILESTLGHVLASQADAPTLVFHEAAHETGYRTRARLAVHAARSVSVGFRAADGKRVVPVEACLVLDPRLAPVLGVIRSILAGASGDGEASVALGSGDRPVLSLRFDGDVPPTTYRALDDAVREGRLGGCDLWLPGTRAPARVGDPSVVTRGGDGEPLAVPSGGFAQANPAMNQLLVDHVASLFHRPLATLELHAGAGNLTVRLAAIVPTEASYETIESDEHAVAACRANLAARGLSNVKIQRGDAETFPLPAKIRRVVLDPPRTGAKAACERIAASRVAEVVYVSCDPPTLARDAQKLLEAGFVPKSLHAFEMFPLTPHVEAVLHLVRP
jgi:23S rRNA (uracil1939-C5)-methyltransferase